MRVKVNLERGISDETSRLFRVTKGNLEHPLLVNHTQLHCQRRTSQCLVLAHPYSRIRHRTTQLSPCRHPRRCLPNPYSSPRLQSPSTPRNEKRFHILLNLYPDRPPRCLWTCCRFSHLFQILHLHGPSTAH